MAALITTYLTDRAEAQKIAACLRTRLPTTAKVTVSSAGYVKVYAATRRDRDVRPLRALLKRAEPRCKL